ncbi:hypothetical protein AYO40_01230 [Planctomycetaceae bacterium SCGC AG-212-D15]|nr:hypothetical protein AYO40_01230 [Planctomycetaceae bacterium SCGC AG-212-D15]
MSSYVSYNGVILPVTDHLSLDRVNVYDGPQFLYQRVTLHVRTIYNPTVTTYAPDPVNATVNGFIVPASTPNTLPATTDSTIRFALAQPRKVLKYVVGDQVLIQSPGLEPDGATPYPCDAKGGPFPTANPIVEAINRTTFLVDWTIETYVNESANNMIVGAPVLSHRWVRRQMIDENFYSTIITTGHAIFPANILAVFQTNAGGAASGQLANLDGRSPVTSVFPDEFRSWLWHAVPNRFKREAATVTANADGVSIDYTLVDRMKNVFFPTGVTRVEASTSVTTSATAALGAGGALKDSVAKARRSQPGLQPGGKGGIESVLGSGEWSGYNIGRGLDQMALGTIGGLGHFLFGGDESGKGAELGNAANVIAAAAIAKKTGIIPMMSIGVSVQVFGDPNPATTMALLYNTAAGVINDRFQQVVNNLNGVQTFAATEVDLQQSLVDKWLVLSVAKVMPLPKDFWSSFGNLNFPNFTKFIAPIPGTSNNLRDATSLSWDVPGQQRAFYSDVIAAQLFMPEFTGTPSPGGITQPQAMPRLTS